MTGCGRGGGRGQGSELCATAIHSGEPEVSHLKFAAVTFFANGRRGKEICVGGRNAAFCCPYSTTSTLRHDNGEGGCDSVPKAHCRGFDARGQVFERENDRLDPDNRLSRSCRRRCTVSRAKMPIRGLPVAQEFPLLLTAHASY